MNIMGIGTISSYIQKLSLDMKRQDRLNNLGKKKEDEEIDPKIAEMKRWAESERRGQAIASIKSKMMSGAYLTEEELGYLQTNSSELYEQAVQIQKERESYKKELENCKSKDDVDKLHQRKMDSFYSEAKQVMSNPHIPKIKKAIKLEFITMRMNAIGNDHAKFIKSEAYNALPDEKFKNKERESDSVNNVEAVANTTDNIECTDETDGINEIDENNIPADSNIEAYTGNELTDTIAPVDPVKAIHEMRASLSVHLPSRMYGGGEPVYKKRTTSAPVTVKKHAVTKP